MMQEVTIDMRRILAQLKETSLDRMIILETDHA